MSEQIFNLAHYAFSICLCSVFCDICNIFLIKRSYLLKTNRNDSACTFKQFCNRIFNSCISHLFQVILRSFPCIFILKQTRHSSIIMNFQSFSVCFNLFFCHTCILQSADSVHQARCARYSPVAGEGLVAVVWMPSFAAVFRHEARLDFGIFVVVRQTESR